MSKRFCLVMGLLRMVGLVCMVSLLSFSAWAVPGIINYQGKLTNTSDCVLTGNCEVQFLLYDAATGGTALWDEVQNISVDNGLFTVHLGAVVTFPIGLFENDSLYLETVIFNPDTGLWETLSPRQRMTSTAYAIKADHAATAGDADTVDGKHASELIVPETDPTVPANLKDGVSWSEISTIPAGFADGVDNTGGGDADTVDGKHASEFLDTSGTTQTKSGSLNIGGNIQCNSLQLRGRTMVDVDGTGQQFLGSIAHGSTYLNSSNHIHFQPGGNCKVTFTADGRVGILTGSPSYTLHVNGSAGKPGGGSWSSSSDKRLKKEIKSLTGALNKLTQLQGVNFEWINPGEHGNQSGIQTGLIAQEVEKVFPEWVSDIDPTGKDKEEVAEGEKIKTLQFPHGFNAYVIEAIKELKAQNEALKALVCQDHPEVQVCQ